MRRRISHVGVAGASGVLLVAAIGPLGCDEAPAPAPVAAATPEATPVPSTPWFEVDDASGIDFVHQSGDRDTFYFPETVCGGVALFDMDGDGDLDAYFVQSGRIVDAPAARPGNRLYENDGAGRFRDVTESSGADDRGYGMGVATGDFDGDGDLDLYVTNVGPNVLLRNDGDGRFVDVGADVGVDHDGWGSSAAFVDYDADGDLDLFVVNYVHWSSNSERQCYGVSGLPDYCNPSHYEAPAMDVLYRNDGAAGFTDVTVASGIASAFGNGLGIGCADFTGDGLVDFFVANDGMKNQLWVNRGDGTFVDEAMIRGCATDLNGQAKAGMGVAVCDVDDDADPDVLVVNIQTETDSFFRNAGSYFKDDTAAVGLGRTSRGFTRFGADFADFDQDGWIDLYEANGGVRRIGDVTVADPFAEPNLLFRGTSAGRFEEVLPRGGTMPEVVRTSRGTAIGDLDGDGDLDLVVANRDAGPTVLRNVAATGRHWVGVRVLDASGGDAIGAVVRVTIGARRITRIVRTSTSYCSSSDPRVHVGLGSSPSYDAIDVRWTDGSTRHFEGGPGDRVVELRATDPP